MFLEAWQFSAVRESRGSRRILYKLLHQYLEYVSDGHVHRRQHHNRLFSGGNTTAGSFGILFGGRVSAYTDSGGYLVIAGLFHGQRLYCNKEKLSVIFNDCRGAVFNIILNFLLIPTHLGIYGAAVATLCSYLLSFLIRIISIRNILPFRIYGGRLFMSILIIAVQIISSSWGGHLNTGIQLSCFLSLAAINIHPLIAYVKSSRL